MNSTAATMAGETLLEITDGRVENTANSSNARAIYNGSTGNIVISGGTVAATGSSGKAIYNYGSGMVTVSGGEISATTSHAIYNYGSGVIAVSEGAGAKTLITSATTSYGTIYLPASAADSRLIITGGTVQNTSSSSAIHKNSTGAIEISGGTVQNTSSGSAIRNLSTGTVNITGGTVSSNTSYAIYNASTGKITISETDGVNNPTLITSESTTGSIGTIFLDNPATALPENTTLLEITGGTVENTVSNANARAIYNGSTGNIVISGGMVTATGSGYGIYNNSTGSVTVLDGTVNIYGGTVSSYGSSAVYNNGTGAVNIYGGTVSVLSATSSCYAIYNSSTGKITISEDDATNPTLITAASTAGATIHLDAGTDGSIILEITGGTVQNNSSSYAIHNNSKGTIEISGGTVSATTGVAVYNNSTGKIMVSGDAEITSANTSSNLGTIYLAGGTTGETILEITGGTVENTTRNNTNARVIFNAGAGNILVSGGTISSVNGSAIRNSSTGSVIISGGTVETNTGRAIHNNMGTVTISGTAKVTSKVTTATDGTIYLSSVDATLNYVEGTIENTAGGNLIYNPNGATVIVTYMVTVTGGTANPVSGVSGNGEWKKDSNGGFIVTADGEFNQFDGVKVNGNLISADNYTVTSGSTVVTLKKEYLDTLANGNYTIEILFKDGGKATTTLTIAAATGGSNGGDNKDGLSGGAIAGIVIACVMVAALGGFAIFWFVIKKKKFSDLIAVFKKNPKQ